MAVKEKRSRGLWKES